MWPTAFESAPAGSQEGKDGICEIRPRRRKSRRRRARHRDDWGRHLWPFDVEALCAKARQATGLEDFGAPPIEQALSVLVDSLEREANSASTRPVPDANASFGFVEDPLATGGRVEKTAAGGHGVFAYRTADFHHGHAAQRFDVPSRIAGGRPRLEGAPSLGSHVSCHRERAGQRLARPAGLERRDVFVVVSPAVARRRTPFIPCAPGRPTSVWRFIATA